MNTCSNVELPRWNCWPFLVTANYCRASNKEKARRAFISTAIKEPKAIQKPKYCFMLVTMTQVPKIHLVKK